MLNFNAVIVFFKVTISFWKRCSWFMCNRAVKCGGSYHVPKRKTILVHVFRAIHIMDSVFTTVIWLKPPTSKLIHDTNLEEMAAVITSKLKELHGLRHRQAASMVQYFCSISLLRTLSGIRSHCSLELCSICVYSTRVSLYGISFVLYVICVSLC